MSPDSRFALIAGAVLAASGVALGAFGAHGLRTLFPPEALGWWQTAVQYQMGHALAVLGIGISGRAWASLPACLMAGGALVFSGTLFAMALGAPHWLGAVTPIGGATMIIGWAVLAWRAARG